MSMRWFGRSKDRNDDYYDYDMDVAWNEISYARDDLNIHDAVERREYIETCLQQLQEASRELDNLQYEYRTVTSYLKDMDELEMLTPEQRRQIEEVADLIHQSEMASERFSKRRQRMSEESYFHMQRIEKDIESGIMKLLEAQDYQKKIRNDLRRLDSERQAYIYQREELNKIIGNTRGLMFLCAGSLAAVLIGLFFLNYYLNVDVTYGYMIAVLIAALSATILYINHMSALRESKVVSGATSRLINLQNTVKIRYVNNRQLLDYLTLKYGTEKAGDLQKDFENYKMEKAERELHEKSLENLDSLQQDLIYLLRGAGLVHPDIWLNQVAALLDHGEAVEIRHELNARRQSLRERMDYNREVVAGNAKAEIEDLARAYPQYAEEILDAVGRYQELLSN